MAQNIFDNELFFREYKNLRENEPNYNDLLEQPAMRALLPHLQGKRVLDIGCGFGHNCRDFVKRGAKSVVGMDLSEKMLSVAKEQNTLPQITYIRMDMANIDKLSQQFDFVYSSLAFHYAENFTKLAKDIYALLEKGGQLLFSQEHPLVTATKKEGGQYLLDENGEAAAFAFSDYAESGKRSGTWFVDGVENYHRPMGGILTTLCDTGFILEKITEPLPSSNALLKRPGMKKEFIKPTFLIIRARK